jgi:hypothetical protein
MSIPIRFPSLSVRQWQALAYYGAQYKPSAFHSTTDTSLMQRRLIRRVKDSFGLELTDEGRNVVGRKATVDRNFALEMEKYR